MYRTLLPHSLLDASGLLVVFWPRLQLRELTEAVNAVSRCLQWSVSSKHGRDQKPEARNSERLNHALPPLRLHSNAQRVTSNASYNERLQSRSQCRRSANVIDF